MAGEFWRDRDAALEALVRAALEEDVGPGDFTTLWTVDEGRVASAIIVAKAALTISGTDAAIRVFRALDPDLRVRVLAGDGEAVEAEEVVMTLAGSARSILTGERTALNFLGRLSGVATLTARFAREVAGTGARVIDTRKTTPGWRLLEKEAVRHGGGENHRVGLHDMVLIKENHIAAAGGIPQAVARVREANVRGLPVELEVTSLEELRIALELGVERVLLDNMSPDQLRTCVQEARAPAYATPILEASGNVTLDTVRRVAETGVDLISVGALTHSAPCGDLSLRIVEA